MNEKKLYEIMNLSLNYDKKWIWRKHYKKYNIKYLNFTIKSG